MWEVPAAGPWKPPRTDNAYELSMLPDGMYMSYPKQLPTKASEVLQNLDPSAFPWAGLETESYLYVSQMEELLLCLPRAREGCELRALNQSSLF